MMRIILDPTKCDGAGVCAEVFPEWVTLDDWGYPMVERGEIPKELEVHARHAVASCPKLALRLEKTERGVRQRRSVGVSASTAGSQSAR